MIESDPHVRAVEATLFASEQPMTVEQIRGYVGDDVDIADALAEAKARKVSRKFTDTLVLGADQILVTADGAILDKPESPDEARAQLATLAKADQPGYRAMAQLVEANLLGEDGETKKAVALYAKVAADGSLPQTFRDLALIRQVSAEFDSIPPQQVVDRLKPLATPGHVWFGSAGELTALAYVKMGKDNLAGPIFAQIAKQDDMPQSLRSRSQQMAGALGVDTVQVDAKRNAASKADETASKGE